MTPTDLIPADTLAALPLWSSDGLRTELEGKLQAAAAEMRWDWIPADEAFALTVKLNRSQLPENTDIATQILQSLFLDWRVVLHWGKGAMELEFFPIQAYVPPPAPPPPSITGNDLSGDLSELTVAELKEELEWRDIEFASRDRKADLIEKLEAALGR